MTAKKKSPMVRLTKAQLQAKLDFMKEYIKAPNAATGAILDPNANVSQKNISTLQSEIHKDINIQINRTMMYDKLELLYGKEIADEYIRQLEAHEIYKHDESSLFPYCVSITMYPYLLHGTTLLGGSCDSPKHLDSFCGSFLNLVYEVAAQFAGAVATPEWLLCFDHFARKDFGDDYLESHREIVHAGFNSAVYGLNEPAAARNYQAVFWNISLFDEHYFNHLFGDFVFPDMDRPKWETFKKLQAEFLAWFNKEREKKVLTFPVVTVARLDDGEMENIDEEFLDLISEEASEGNAFFTYTSPTVDSLASCCFDGKQEVLVKNSSNGIELVRLDEYHSKLWIEKKNPTVYHDGNWCQAKSVKIKRSGKKMYKITTANKKTLYVTEDHLHPTLGKGDVRSDALEVGDALQFSSSVLTGDGTLTYEDGLLIGAYLGDGSIYHRKTCNSVEVTLSLNSDKYSKLSKIVGGWSYYEGPNNVVFAKTCSKEVASFIESMVSGSKAHNKELNLKCLSNSVEFRRGILDGMYITDGGNNNRIYTTSERLSKQLEVLCTSLGIHTAIDKSDRTDEVVVIRGEEYKRNHPLYCVRWYESNKRAFKGVYKKWMGNTYFYITDIEEVEGEDHVYCFEMKDKDEPYFTLPSGVVTHNCRLRNALDSSPQFSYSLGAGGVATGSISVMTLNLNRLEQDADRNLPDEIAKLHMYQMAYRSLIQDKLDEGMLPVYTAGFISLDKQFSTIGLSGIADAAEAKGLVVGNNPEYVKYCQDTLKVIYDANQKMTLATGCKFNTEFVPIQ